MSVIVGRDDDYHVKMRGMSNPQFQTNKHPLNGVSEPKAEPM
jgi:hypothetical protein